jgi:hypothetical protein
VYCAPSFIFLKFSNFGFSTILNSFFQIGVVTTVLFDTCAELCRYMGRAALGLGFITLLTGITRLGERDGFDHVKSLQAALFAWFLLITGLVIYIEMCRTRRPEDGYKIGDSSFEQGHIIGEEEEDSSELLQSSFLGHTKNSQEQSDTRGMEVQLEAF